MNKRIKPTKRASIQKTYIGYLTFPSEIHEKLMSYCLITRLLWNLTVQECWNRLRVLSAIHKERTPSDKEKKANGISPVSLNYWLPGLIARTQGLQGFLTEQLRQTVKEVSASFSSYFELKKNGDEEAKKPEAKDPNIPFILTLVGVKMEDENLFVSFKKGEKILIPLDNYLKSKLSGVVCSKGGTDVSKSGEFSDVTIRFRPDKKKWQISVAVKYPVPEKAKSIIVRSIDLGAGDIALSDSDGCESLIPNRRSDKHWGSKIAECEEKAKRCTSGSRRWKKRTGARRRIFNTQSNQLLDFQKRLADVLTKNVGTIVIGKGMKTGQNDSRIRLGLAKSTGDSKEHYSVQNTGYMFRLLQLIENKAKERGVVVIKVPDKSRVGPKDDSSSKFNASRAMLMQYLKGRGLESPSEWEEKRIIVKIS